MDGGGLYAAVGQVFGTLAPPPHLLPSEWAETAVSVPVGSAIPGLISFENAPYQREPLDMTVNPECNEITLEWGAQTGKTMVALCAQAYRIAVDPQNQLMMQPSEGDLTAWLETKFQPMVDANPEIATKLATPRGREGVNNTKMKSYTGGFIMFAYSGSPRTMRGRSAPFIVCDEVDGYLPTKEGHPVGLFEQRGATYGDRRVLFKSSTPTVKGESYIDDSFEQGDKRRFHVDCPCCGHSQVLEWAQVKWDRHPDGRHNPTTAHYECVKCKERWTDGMRFRAIRGGRWIAEKPFEGHASYHLNEIYSCFVPLAAMVRSFLKKKATGDLQTFNNVSLAIVWEEEGDKVDAVALMERVEPFDAQVPAGGVVLTAGIDMQPDRLELEVVAWGLGEESWSVDYRVLWGAPSQGDVWDELDLALAATYRHASEAELPIVAAALDTGGTGGDTTAAYDYASTRLGRRLFAIKGFGGWGRPIVSAATRQRRGRNARPVSLFKVGVDEAKLLVQRRLHLQVPGPGYCHFPENRDPEFFAQITAEKLRTRYIKGFPIREWIKERDRNEALDNRVYALAALKILNPNIGAMHKRMNAALAADPPEEDQAPRVDGQPKTKATRRRRVRRRRKGGGWVENW